MQKLKYMALLERLIDYDLKEAQRKAELARMEQERKRIEVMRRSLDKIRAAPKFLLQGRRSEIKSGQGVLKIKLDIPFISAPPPPSYNFPFICCGFMIFNILTASL